MDGPSFGYFWPTFGHHSMLSSLRISTNVVKRRHCLFRKLGNKLLNWKFDSTSFTGHIAASWTKNGTLFIKHNQLQANSVIKISNQCFNKNKYTNYSTNVGIDFR